MRRLGEVRNRAHDGLFIVICDATARFGGWDVHGEMLADEGSAELDLEGLRAFVEEAHGSGSHEVYQSDNRSIWIQPPTEPGIERIPLELLETAPRTKVIEMGRVDVPSGTLTVALAYPPLNMTTDGDHAGLKHEEGERVDVVNAASAFVVTREFVGTGQVVALHPQ